VEEDEDVAAFLARFEEELGSGGEAAFREATSSTAIAFGLDPTTLFAEAFRRALPAGSATHLEVLLWLHVPATEAHVVALRDPGGRIRSARRRVVDVAVAITRAKSAVHQVRTGAPASDLYDALNATLTTAAAAVQDLGVLAKLEERGVIGVEPLRRVPVVPCPLAGAPVSTDASCARCRWRGPALASCVAVEAQRYLRALARAGHELPTVLSANATASDAPQAPTASPAVDASPPSEAAPALAPPPPAP
jgi:hypothetical protein